MSVEPSPRVTHDSPPPSLHYENTLLSNTPSSLHKESTLLTNNSVLSESDPYTSVKSDVEDDDGGERRKLSEHNHRNIDHIDSSNIRPSFPLEVDHLTSKGEIVEESDKTFQDDEPTTSFPQKTSQTTWDSMNNDQDDTSPQSRNEFLETICGFDNTPLKAEDLDDTERSDTIEEKLNMEEVYAKKYKQFEVVKDGEENSNRTSYESNHNFHWASASPEVPLRRWDSDPTIITEADEPLKHVKGISSVYRLSLRYSKNLKCNVEKSYADGSLEKAGFLQKLSGRGFPYLNQWKRRYCVLTKGRLYLYEKESNRSTDKCTSVIDLKYFDHVTEAMQKDSKKVSNVFVVTSQDRTFFDQGRHLFAADTLTDMHDWIAKLRESIELIRNNNRPAKGTKTQQSKRNSQGSPTEEKTSQQVNQKEGECEQRDDVDYSASLTDVVDARVANVQEEFKSKQEFTSSLKKKLKIESLDAKNDEETVDKEPRRENEEKLKNCSSNESNQLVKKISSTTISLQNPNLLQDTKPQQLESITKHRIRGPAGRRAPQSRRTIMMKERASSMSALQQEGQADNEVRSETVHGTRASTLTADGVLLAGSPSPNLSKNSDIYTSFDDIESALFFKRPSPLREETSQPIQRQHDKKKKSTFSFRNFRISKTLSEKSTKEKTFSIFRSNTFKFRAFRSNNAAAAEHPDSSIKSKICSIL